MPSWRCLLSSSVREIRKDGLSASEIDTDFANLHILVDMSGLMALLWLLLSTDIPLICSVEAVVSLTLPDCFKTFPLLKMFITSNAMLML